MGLYLFCHEGSRVNLVRGWARLGFCCCESHLQHTTGFTFLQQWDAITMCCFMWALEVLTVCPHCPLSTSAVSSPLPQGGLSPAPPSLQTADPCHSVI